MKFSEVELPSNNKFGFFFTVIFGIVATYFYVIDYTSLSYSMFGASVIFLLITIVKAEILLPLNKLWMRFGLLLGMIVSPVVLGVIFFGLFTPVALLMKLVGRDELRLKLKNKPSYWTLRSDLIQPESFKYQF